jgi:hypothetical protein
MLKVVKKIDLINEVLGVPNGLPNVAQILTYDLIKQQIKDNDNFNTLNNRVFNFPDNFYIGDILFKGAEIKFLLTIGSEIKFNGKYVLRTDYETIDKDLNFKEKDKNNLKIKLYSKFIVPSDVTGKSLKEHLEKNFGYYRSVYSHEIKHIYDFIKRPNENIKSDAKDINYNDSLVKQVDELSNDETSSKYYTHNFKLLQYLNYCGYYVNTMESLVRTSQVFSDMQWNNISKKNFLKYIMSNEVVKQLKIIQSYTFEQFYENALNNSINYWSEKSGESPSQISENMKKSLIDIFLSQSYSQFIKGFRERFASWILNKSDVDRLFYDGKISNELTKTAIDNFTNDIYKVKSKNPETFFKNIFKKNSEKATKLLKKIYKLYAIAFDDFGYMDKYPKAFQKPKYQQNIYNPINKL